MSSAPYPEGQKNWILSNKENQKTAESSKNHLQPAACQQQNLKRHHLACLGNIRLKSKHINVELQDIVSDVPSSLSAYLL